MNRQIKEALETLTAAVRSGEEYKNYRSLRESIDNQPEKKNRLDSFRRMQYEACMEEDGGFEKAEELFLIKQELEKDPECRDFLFWENVFCSEIQKISETVLMLADVDVPR